MAGLTLDLVAAVTLFEVFAKPMFEIADISIS
jgi:hypothetical protein